MKKLIKPTLLLSLLLLISLIAIDILYRHVTERGFEIPRSLLVHPSIPNKFQIVTVGNSHADSGIDFSHYNLRSLKLSGVAQRFSYDLALLKQNHNRIEKNAVIIIPVTPISFSHRKADRHDGLQYNFYGVLSPVLIPDLIVSDYLQQEIFPFIRSGYLLRKWYADKVDARIAEEERWEEPEEPQATPSAATKPPKLAIPYEEIPYNVGVIEGELAVHSPVDPAKYVDNMNFIFHKWYETEEFGTQYFEQNRKDLESLIRYCKGQGWRPILITIPITQVLEDGLLDDYMDTYLYQNMAKVDTQGAEYWDYSEDTDLSGDLFLYGNADHLNDRGGATFSYLLMQDLIDKGYLPESVDGYNYGPVYLKESEQP